MRLKDLGVIGATVKDLMRDDKKDLNESLIYATLVANMNNGARIDVQCHMFSCLYECAQQLNHLPNFKENEVCNYEYLL